MPLTRTRFTTQLRVAAALCLFAPLLQAQSLSIDDITVTEGGSANVTATFAVSLPAPAGPGGDTFDIATADNTALGGADYIANTQQDRTISAGETTADFVVVINDDNQFEGLQTYFVNITSVSGATLPDAQGTGTINDDEPLPTAAFPASAPSADEGAAGTTTPVVVTAALSGASEVPLSFSYATADVTASAEVDYLGTSGTLDFAPGELQKQITVSFIGDNFIESDESFTLELRSPRDGDTHTLTILNDDAAAIANPPIPIMNFTGAMLLLAAIAVLAALQLRRQNA